MKKSRLIMSRLIMTISVIGIYLFGILSMRYTFIENKACVAKNGKLYRQLYGFGLVCIKNGTLSDGN